VKAAGLSESRALAILQEELPQFGASTLVGIGDDAAVLQRPSQKLVWTIDACGEGTHFKQGWLSPEDLAHKSLQAAVSDLCAMGARPTAALVQLTLAPWWTVSRLRRLAREQAAVCRVLGCPIVGGNLTRAAEVQLVTTALGQLPGRPLQRTGAQAGDELWLVGAVGRARLGQRALERGWQKKSQLAACVGAFRRPRALVEEGLRLARVAHACLDVSDGLRRDAPRLARASGVRIVLEESRLARLVDQDFRRAADALGLDPVREMVDGGEDYALLATGPAGRRPRAARIIGRVERGRGAWLEGVEGRTELEGGFEH